MRVLKFGGTSVGTAERIRRVADIVLDAAARERVAVVVSAMAGVTDALVAAAEGVARGDVDGRTVVERLADRHLSALALLSPNGRRPIAEAAVRAALDALAAQLDAARLVGECPPARRDAILATGERLVAPLLAAKLRARGLDALVVDGSGLIVTDAAFGEATVDWSATARRIEAAFAGLPPTAVPVITGFIGADSAGRTTTLGRGGSDYTASLVAAALRASAVEIWTDVDGVLTAPPRLVADAVTVPRLSYAEAAALAALGAKVLHPKCIAPATQRGVPILVCNSFNPSGPRTTITAEGDGRSGEPKAVAPLECPSKEGAIELAGSPWKHLPGTIARPRQSRSRLEAAPTEHWGRCNEIASKGQPLGVLAVVGEGIGAHPRMADRLGAVLGGGGHRVLALAAEPRGLAVAALVPAAELAAAAVRLHAGLGLGAARCEGPGAACPPATHSHEHMASGGKATR